MLVNHSILKTSLVAGRGCLLHVKTHISLTPARVAAASTLRRLQREKQSGYRPHLVGLVVGSAAVVTIYCSIPVRSANAPVYSSVRETSTASHPRDRDIRVDATKATEILRLNETSYFVDRDRGVARYDFNQVASNSPIEDDHIEQIVQFDGERGDWAFWGLFDGHSGMDCEFAVAGEAYAI